MIPLEQVRALINNKNISDSDLNDVITDFEILSNVIIDSYLMEKKNKSPP